MGADSTTPGAKPLDGPVLGLLLVAAMAAGRFGRAGAEVAKYGEDVAVGWLTEGWIIGTLITVGLAGYVGRRMIAIAEALDPPATVRHCALRILVYGALASWFVWQATAIASITNADLILVRNLSRALAVVCGLAAVAWAGGVVAGDATAAWERASVVRLQLILLAALVVLVLFGPITSAQCLDVLRGWGDGSWKDGAFLRASLAIAGALLLGAVCKSSADRLLRPEDEVRYSPQAATAPLGRACRSLARSCSCDKSWMLAAAPCAPLVPIAIVLALLGLKVAAIAVAMITVLAAVTRWDAPVARARDNERSLRRIAATMGLVPLGLLLAGLSSASVDSLLLSSAASGSDRRLLAWAVVVLLLFGWRVGDAHVEREAPPRRLPILFAGAAGLLALAIGLGAVPAADSVLGAGLLVAPAFFLAVAAVLGARLLPDRGATELWVGVGVTLATAAAIYVGPVSVPRAVGTFGLVFIGATGLLLVLHGAGSVGARRAFRPPWLTWPDRAPVVALLGTWAVLAFLMAPESVHRVRTLKTAAKPVSLQSAVRGWLRVQAADPVHSDRNAPFVPMLLLAASGGGSKAGYWTDLVIDCLLGEGIPGTDGECTNRGDIAGRYGRLLLTSSVSGGSIGVRHLIENAPRMTAGKSWVNKAAGTDVLSPLIAWGLFHDLPAFLLGADLDPDRCRPGRRAICRLNADRALVQEAAIVGGSRERLGNARDHGLLGRAGPVTVFNAAQDGASRRVLLSRVNLAPLPQRYGCSPPGRTPESVNTAIDAHDVLPPGVDLPLVTAALISARFPVLEPAAQLGNPKAADPTCEHPAPRSVLARDGGYIENTGLLTIVELLPAITGEITRWQADKTEPHRDVKVRVIVLSIDDDPVEKNGVDIGGGARGAFGVGRKAGTGFLTAGAREALDRCAVPGVSAFRVSPPRRVGAKAATGWEISDTTRREDLAAALKRGEAADVISGLRRGMAGAAQLHGCNKFVGGTPSEP